VKSFPELLGPCDALNFISVTLSNTPAYTATLWRGAGGQCITWCVPAYSSAFAGTRCATRRQIQYNTIQYIVSLAPSLQRKRNSQALLC